MMENQERRIAILLNIIDKISHLVRNELSVPLGMIEDALTDEDITREDFLDSEKSLGHLLDFFRDISRFTHLASEEIHQIDLVELLQITFLRESKNEVFIYNNELQNIFLIEANENKVLFLLRNIRDFLISKLNYYNYSSKVEILVDKNKIYLDLTNFTYLFETFYRSQKNKIDFSSLLAKDQTVEAIYLDLSALLLSKYNLTLLAEMLEDRMFLTISIG